MPTRDRFHLILLYYFPSQVAHIYVPHPSVDGAGCVPRAEAVDGAAGVPIGGGNSIGC